LRSLQTLDSTVTFRNSQGDAGRGTLTSVKRRALTLEIYNPHSIVQLSEVLADLTVRSSARAIYGGTGVVTSLVNTGLMAVVSVTLTDEWNDLVAVATEPGGVRREAQAFIDDWDQRFVLRRDYQVVVSELRSYLSEITRWVDQADIGAGLPYDDSGRLRLDVFHELAEPLLHRGQDYLHRFEHEASKVDEERAPLHRSFAQAALHPLILRAPFVYRTFAKPLGYAGDYEMVNQILGDPRQGPSTYFQLVNFMFLQAGVARAHRNRIDILQDYLDQVAQRSLSEGRAMRVLNVGCGPAVEIQNWLRVSPHAQQVEFVLVDFSEETLAYTSSQLRDAAGTAPLRVVTRHESVNQLLKRATRDEHVPEHERFDYVYCAGLFDYLSDKVCARLIEYFISRCRPGAKLLVTNVHANNPERHWMEHFLEWYLIYRDEKDVERLLPGGLLDVATWTDSTGVNVFAGATVPG
jgi:extracellular factor (EF) 3-hydroxypalmitic acid methyl ester biosynthesis protein